MYIKYVYTNKLSYKIRADQELLFSGIIMDHNRYACSILISCA